MNQSGMSCPKCQGEMIRGFVIDRSSAAVFVDQWVPATPESLKMRQYLGGIIKFRDQVTLPRSDEMIPVGTFRCQACGYLESYAREEFGAT